MGSPSKSYTCSNPCRTTPWHHQVKPGQKNHAHNLEGATRHGGDDEIVGEEGILLGPGRSLRNRRQQRTPIKVLRHSLPLPRRVRPSLRLLHCSSSRRFSENKRLPPTNQPDRPHSVPHPHGSGSRSDLYSLLGGGRPGRSRDRHHPEASARQPAPTSSARFLPRCAGARGQTLRRWASGRNVPTTASPPPPPTRAVVSLIWDPSQ